MSDRFADQTEALKSLCAGVVERARKKGARVSEAFAERSRQASATVVNGEIEELSEAASKGVGLRVIVDGRLGFASTTDFSANALESLVERAVALARASAPDEANALPTKRELSLTDRPRVARLFDPAVAYLDTAW